MDNLKQPTHEIEPLLNEYLTVLKNADFDDWISETFSPLYFYEFFMDYNGKLPYQNQSILTCIFPTY